MDFIVDYPIGILVGVLFLAFFLLLLEIFTIGYAAVRRHQDRRKNRIRPKVREEILTRLSTRNTNWEPWCRELTKVERKVAAEVIKELLEHSDDNDAKILKKGLHVLNIGRDARTKLATGDRIDKLNALSWLFVLQESPPVSILWDHCSSDSVLRGAAARVASVDGTDNARREAISLLFANTEDGLSVLGMDTLYRIGVSNPSLLHSVISTNVDRLSTTQLNQVLLVIAELGKTTAEARFEKIGWIIDLLDHQDRNVRHNAVLALINTHTGDELATRISLEELLTDSSPQVRKIAVRAIKEWKVPAGTELLDRRLQTEPDERVHLAIVEAFADYGLEPDRPWSERTATAWQWTQEVRERERGL